MQRKTTTQQLNNALSNDLLHITKAEIHYKSSQQVNALSVESFKESLEFLTETIFMEMIDWHYERNFNVDGEYIFECGRMNPHSEIIITAYLNVVSNATEEDIEQTLLFLED